jgi:hypothetical protein
MNISTPLVPNSEPTELMQPCKGSLHYPSVNSKTTSVGCIFLGDVRLNSSAPQLVSVAFRVVTSVCVHSHGPFSGLSPAAFYGWNAVHHFLKCRTVVRIGGGQANAQGNARPVGYNMMLASFSGPVGRARTGFFPHRLRHGPYWNRWRHGTSQSAWHAAIWLKALRKSFARPRQSANPVTFSNRSSHCLNPFPWGHILRESRFEAQRGFQQRPACPAWACDRDARKGGAWEGEGAALSGTITHHQQEAWPWDTSCVKGKPLLIKIQGVLHYDRRS